MAWLLVSDLETANLLRFMYTTVTRVCTEYCKRLPLSSSSVGRNALLIKEVRMEKNRSPDVSEALFRAVVSRKAPWNAQNVEP